MLLLIFVQIFFGVDGFKVGFLGHGHFHRNHRYPLVREGAILEEITDRVTDSDFHCAPLALTTLAGFGNGKLWKIGFNEGYFHVFDSRFLLAWIRSCSSASARC